MAVQLALLPPLSSHQGGAPIAQITCSLHLLADLAIKRKYKTFQWFIKLTYKGEEEEKHLDSINFNNLAPGEDC